MTNPQPITFLCMTSEFKGTPLIEACRNLGCHVILLTKEKWKNEAWPRASIDELYFMPDLSKRQEVIHAVSYLERGRHIDRIFPLDDFDGEMAAALREHLRLPGLGETAIRFFRDKLAMRQQTRANGIAVPEFVGVLNYDRLRDFMLAVSPPWVLKPRGSAGSMGIKLINDPEVLWRWLDRLGDEQSSFLLEQFVAGDVFHVDSVVSEGEVVFDIAHQYGRPPMAVSHGGGVFTSRTMRRDDDLTQSLLALNRKVIAALGMVRGVNHIEYIRGQADSNLYFLEAAARVGGANIADMVEYATGLNLWHEWAKIEFANTRGEPYHPPEVREGYAGVLQCLATQEHPDFSAYSDPEVKWHSDKTYHAGMIVASTDPARVEHLLNDYSIRFSRDFLAVLPPLDKPPA